MATSDFEPAATSGDTASTVCPTAACIDSKPDAAQPSSGDAASQQTPESAAASENKDAIDGPMSHDIPVNPVDSRPTDEAILAHENTIRAEAAQQPLLGELESLDTLTSEYQQGSTVWLQKIQKLASSYSKLRRARKDGNCFYRCFLFGLLEHLVLSNDLALRDRLVERLVVCEHKMVEAGFQKMVFEDALQLLLDNMRAIAAQRDPFTQQVLWLQMQDEYMANFFIMFLRLLTSSEIRRREEFFAPFVLGLSDMSVEDFCQRMVEPMGEESDHVHIVALTDALGVPIRVVYLDGSGGGAMAAAVGSSSDGDDVDVVHHDFVADTESATPLVHLLYRPGHYDVLYAQTL